MYKIGEGVYKQSAEIHFAKKTKHVILYVNHFYNTTYLSSNLPAKSVAASSLLDSIPSSSAINDPSE